MRIIVSEATEGSDGGGMGVNMGRCVGIRESMANEGVVGKYYTRLQPVEPTPNKQVLLSFAKYQTSQKQHKRFTIY